MYFWNLPRCYMSHKSHRLSSNRRIDWKVGLKIVKRIKSDFSNSSFVDKIITSALENRSSNKNENNKTSNPKFRKGVAWFCYYTATDGHMKCLWELGLQELQGTILKTGPTTAFLYQTTRSHLDSDLFSTFVTLKASNPTCTNCCFQACFTPIRQRREK